MGRVVMSAWMRARPSKYGARACVVEGIRFDSKREARRWVELQLLERAGQIRDLRRQVAIPLHAVGGTFVGAYVCDFEYREVATGQVVTEDTKGVRTALYIWKRRHVQAEHGITIREL